MAEQVVEQQPQAQSEGFRGIRRSSMLLVGKVVATVLDFVALVIAVRYLSQTDYGAFTYALSVILLLQTICKFGLPDTVARFIPIERERNSLDRMRGILLISVTCVLALGLAAAAVTWVLAPRLEGILVEPEPLQLILILVFMVPFEALTEVLTAIFACYKRLSVIVLRGSILAPVLKLGVMSTLVWLDVGVVFLARGYLVASVLATCLYVWLCLRMLRQEGVISVSMPVALRAPTRDLMIFAPSLLLASLVWILIESADALLLGYFHGAASVALLRSVTPMARVNQIITGSFVVLFTPMAAEYYARGDKQGMQRMYVRTAAWITTLAFPALLLTLVFGGTLVRTLYGESYEPAIPILAVLSFGYFVQASTGFNGLTIKIYNHVRYAVIIDILACVLNVVVNLYAIPRWGAMGAAVGTTTVLLLHNSLKQIGARWLAGVQLFEPAFLRLLGIAGALLLVAYQLNRIFAPNLVEAILVVIAESAILVYLSRRTLQIDETFPEVLRVPVLRRVLSSAH